MQKLPLSVLIAGEQDSNSAQHEIEKLAEAVTRGELKGVVVSDFATAADGGAATTRHRVLRKGAVLGARAGFLFGIVSLVTSTLIGAGAGALIAKASELRIDKGSPPSIHFAQGRR